jgi:MinD superfamily P-loop ATPase
MTRAGAGRRGSLGPLRVALASGKGGTGKTTLATSLAVALAEAGVETAYVDCDVEEPNGHLFLQPSVRWSREVTLPVPQVDESRCTSCGACATACRFSAILALGGKVLTFPKLCHGCGGCALACPEGAIRELPRVTGTVEGGTAGLLGFLQGRLEVGEALAPPVVRAALAAVPEGATVVIDAPPGTSCPVIAAVEAADVVLLVTEPTPFGLNDLRLAVEMTRALSVPFGVAVNRSGEDDGAVLDYCAAERIPVLLAVPDDPEIARAYSRGELALAARPELRPRLLRLHEQLVELSLAKAPACPRPLAAPAAEPAAREEPPPVQLGSGGDLHQLVVVSGKGGTGKTSIAASFFALAAGRAAVADCDVDAADLHLVLSPAVQRRRPFSGGMTAVVDPERCSGCGLCAARCRFDAILPPGDGAPACGVDPVSCEGCGVCADACPEGAVRLVPSASGEWFTSETRHGPMVHARLGVAQENSGKLVSLVRREGAALARSRRRELLICDGSPGIGCPVIASITGAQLVLVVTEPTPSGLHDLGRVAELCRQLGVPARTCINKADVNPAVADALEADAARQGVPVLGRVRYDRGVTQAQVRQLTVVEHGLGPAAADLRALWARVQGTLGRA